MSGEKKAPIIVKRIKKAGHGHHGGAWKIAYADFVTAMMAFFLLMWLLGSTTQGDLQGIAEFFKSPLKVALAGGSGSGDSSSVLKGGGKDLTRSTGQKQMTDTPNDKKTINLLEAAALLEGQETMRLKELKARLDSAIDANEALRPYKKQLQVDITADGLRVQIVDEQNRPMFDSGSAALKDYTRQILHELGKLMNDVPNRISLSGHTDANPYALGERAYSNWELSADRANASRRELIVGGIEEKKIIRIVGLGAAVALDKNDPYSPANRRISIVVLNHKAETRILGDSVMAEPAPAAEPPKPAAESTSVEPSAPGAAPQHGAAAAPAVDAARESAAAPAAEPVAAGGVAEAKH